MSFHSKLNKLLKLVRYGLAPDKDINAILERHNEHGGGFDPNNQADQVLADKLDDYDDPRAKIIRQDLEHRKGGVSKFNSNVYNYIKQRFNITNLKHGKVTSYPTSVGRLYVGEGNTDKNNKPIFYQVEWSPNIGYFVAVFSPEETIQLLDQLGLEHDLHKVHGLDKDKETTN